MRITETPRRIRITKIHKDDAFYKDREQIVGHKGTFTPRGSQPYPGYFTGVVDFDHSVRGLNSIYFLGIRYKRLPEEE